MKVPTMQSTTKLAFTLDEAATALTISRSTLTRAIKRGDVTAVKLGGRVLISAGELARILDGEAS